MRQLNYGGGALVLSMASVIWAAYLWVMNYSQMWINLALALATLLFVAIVLFGEAQDSDEDDLTDWEEDGQ